jgi:hypothetical protein
LRITVKESGSIFLPGRCEKCGADLLRITTQDDAARGEEVLIHGLLRQESGGSMSEPIDMKAFYDALDDEQQENDRYSMREYAGRALQGLLAYGMQVNTAGAVQRIISLSWDLAEGMYVEEMKRFREPKEAKG